MESNNPTVALSNNPTLSSSAEGQLSIRQLPIVIHQPKKGQGQLPSHFEQVGN